MELIWTRSLATDFRVEIKEEMAKIEDILSNACSAPIAPIPPWMSPFLLLSRIYLNEQYGIMSPFKQSLSLA
jgi:hypothetical protein